MRCLVVQLLLELAEALDGLLQLPVLERDRGVIRERLEQLEVVEIELADLAEPIGDEDRPDEVRLAEQRRDQRASARRAPSPVLRVAR